MIKLLTHDKIMAYREFCRTHIFGAVLNTRLSAYGLDDLSTMFWYAENEDGMTAACGMQDGIFTFCCNDHADKEEIAAFAQIMGAKESTSAENCAMLYYRKSGKHYAAENVSGENLKDIFPVIFENDIDSNAFFEKWYTDASHKIRHGLIHGKCIFENGKCVSAALTSGETEKIAVISSVATLTAYRRMGYGERVVNSLAENLHQKAYLMTDNHDTAAWYQSIGWIKTT